MNKVCFFIVILLSGVFLAACGPDPNGIDPPYVTTPYDFIDYPHMPPPNFASDNKPTEEGVLLGRMLFYDPILSGDSTQSCASCHNQKYAFTDNGKALSIGIRNLPGTRNSMPLFNMQWQLTGFFWDGRAELLRHQALLPIQDPLEMDETIGNMLAKLNSSQVYREQFKKAFNIDEIDEEHVALAIEQFISIIVSASSKFDIGKVLGFTNFNDEELRGMNIFQQEAKPNDPNNTGADCGHCHGTNLFMIQEFMNNGLDSLSEDPGRMNVTGNTNDRGKFKVPSLRNIEKTAPYMHDGRFNTLEEVIEFYMFGVHVNPNIDPGRMHALKDSVFLSSQQRADLIAFLKTLTDTTFLNSTEYSNPFH